MSVSFRCLHKPLRCATKTQGTSMLLSTVSPKERKKKKKHLLTKYYRYCRHIVRVSARDHTISQVGSHGWTSFFEIAPVNGIIRNFVYTRGEPWPMLLGIIWCGGVQYSYSKLHTFHGKSQKAMVTINSVS